MLRRDLLGAWLATPLAGWLRPLMPRVFGKERDAAVVYRRAFAWSEASRPGDSELFRQLATVANDDPRVDRLIRRARPALDAIREAASIEGCRWNGDPTTTDDLCRGHLDVVSGRKVIEVACLSARWHARNGRGREALDDVFAGLSLAHRIGTGGVMIARVLECGGEIRAFRTLGRILPDLGRASLDDLSRRLEVLPAPEPASATIGHESRFLLRSMHDKLLTFSPTNQAREWDEIGFEEEESAALKRLTGGDRAKLLTHLESTVPAFGELARRLDLPREACRASLDDFARTEKSIHPIAAGLVEGAWGIRHVVDRMQALRSMLQAGLVLVRDGEPAFLAKSDPFGTGAFGLERRGLSTWIRSAMDDDGKPEVSLEIGEAS